MRPLRLVVTLLAVTAAPWLLARAVSRPPVDVAQRQAGPRLVDIATATATATASEAASEAATNETAANEKTVRPAPTGATVAELPDATPAEPRWVERLGRLLREARLGEAGQVGVYVRDLGTSAEFSLNADEIWYLASGIKVPVAVAVLRDSERGKLPLDARLRLEPFDRVDGTGHTNRHDPGALLRVDYLLEQMLVYSDNTASDMLIRRVGLDEVNRLARQLSGMDFKITTLADVRRKTYGALHPEAASLQFSDWVALRRLAASQRAASVSRRVGVDLTELSLASLDQAYDAYYAAAYNSGPLRAYGSLLAQIAAGKALSADGTAYLLAIMSRIQTGKRRLRARLPAGLEFAHKTGTQHRRVCDLGITRRARGSTEASTVANVVLTACARDFASVAAAEQALRRVGAAVNGSGVFDDASPQEERREHEPAQIARGYEHEPAEVAHAAVDEPLARDVRDLR